MWNPETYRDTNFGLDEGELFEPDDAEQADEVDLTQPYIMTVLGPISPDQLGICQHHEHILGDPESTAVPEPGNRNPREIAHARDELEAYYTVGGRSMVDVTTRDQGRWASGLRQISQRVPVNLISVTGVQLQAGMQRNAGECDPGAAGERALDDIANGIDGTDIRPGAIRCAADGDEVSGTVTETIGALARVAATTGYPMMISAPSEANMHEHLDLAVSAGLDPTRIILDNLDRHRDFDALAGLAGRGAWISLDHIGQLQSGEDTARADIVYRLANAGFTDRILVSQGASLPTQKPNRQGTPIWTHLLERFTLSLMEAGVDAPTVRTLLIDNPANALSVIPPG